MMEATLAPAAPAGQLQERAVQAMPNTPILKDLLEDGVYLLFLLRSGTTPHSATEFNRRVDAFLAQFERHATNFGKPTAAIQDCKYAFCALLDEIILNSDFGIRDEWERNPLQLRLFGEHLAGEGFFDRLENLRLEPQKHIETIEVFYTCLLLGFQGKYLLEGEDKLGYLTARIGQEITSFRGGKPDFAPHWKPAFRFQEFVRHELPSWVFYALLALVAMILFLAFTYLLSSRTKELSRVQSLASLQGETAAMSSLT
jgi:type VI secretion system protein ImpK